MKKSFLVRTIILAGSLLLQLSTLCFHSRGAAGDVDLSFDPGSGVNGQLRALAVQSDGKVIVAGDFTTVRGLARYKVARLTADGSGDPSFNPGTALDASVYVAALALQSDGKVLIAVANASYQGYAARLNSDGTLDNSFSPVTDAPVFSLAPQPDGKVLIGGGFSTVNGTNRNGIARLNANGSLDSSFDPGTGVPGHLGGVRSVVVQPDGKVLLGGFFTTVNGTNRSGFARLNANGTLDNSFNPVTDAPVFSVALQPDGKVLIAGGFTTVNGTNRNGMARLSTNGSLDSSFNPGMGADSGVSSIALQTNGKVLITGWFSDVPRSRRIARLDADGSLDSSFDWGAVVRDGGVYPIALQPDGKVLIGGDFFTVNEVERSSIARLNANGTLDSSFQPGRRMDLSFGPLTAVPNGKVLVGGFVHGTNQVGGVRLNANGSLDGTFISAGFHPDLGFIDDEYSHTTWTATVGQPNGKVFIAGHNIYQQCDSETCITFHTSFLDRFNANGSRDTNFERAVVYQPWGRELVHALAVQPDGKIVVGGNFYSIKDTERKGIARLNANGTLDHSFNPGMGAVGYPYGVTSLAVQSDGKVLVGGNGGYRIVRLNANGSFDSSFNRNVGVDGSISSVVSQPDGKVLIGGSFTNVNGTNRNNIARLNADGSLDSSFNPGTGTDGLVRSIALQSDGNVLIGGDFTTVNGVLRPNVARLYGDFAAPSLNIARSNVFMIVSWPVLGTNFRLEENTNLSLANGWSPVVGTKSTNNNSISVALPATSSRKFFRLSFP